MCAQQLQVLFSLSSLKSVDFETQPGCFPVTCLVPHPVTAHTGSSRQQPNNQAHPTTLHSISRMQARPGPDGRCARVSLVKVCADVSEGPQEEELFSRSSNHLQPCPTHKYLFSRRLTLLCLALLGRPSCVNFPLHHRSAAAYEFAIVTRRDGRLQYFKSR